MANKINNYQIAGDITITTTGNIDNLDVKGYSLLRMNNASLSTIRGILAGYPGQLLTIQSVGAGQVNLAHQNTNSSAANRFINTITSIDTPLAAGVGTAIYQYDGETARWRLINHVQGADISFAYNAGDYTTNGATETWTVDSGDIATWVYYIKGSQVFLKAAFNTTTTGVAADATTLRIALPFTVTRSAQNLGRRFINSTGVGIVINASVDNFAGAGRVTIFDLSFGLWPLETNGLYVFFEVYAEIP